MEHKDWPPIYIKLMKTQRFHSKKKVPRKKNNLIKKCIKSAVKVSELIRLHHKHYCHSTTELFVDEIFIYDVNKFNFNETFELLNYHHFLLSSKKTSNFA